MYNYLVICESSAEKVMFVVVTKDPQRASNLIYMNFGKKATNIIQITDVERVMATTLPMQDLVAKSKMSA